MGNGNDRRRHGPTLEPELLDEHLRFYAAEAGWEATLARYPTDAVLVPAGTPVGRLLVEAAGWRVRYGDQTYAIVVRP